MDLSPERTSQPWPPTLDFKIELSSDMCELAASSHANRGLPSCYLSLLCVQQRNILWHDNCESGLLVPIFCIRPKTKSFLILFDLNLCDLFSCRQSSKWFVKKKNHNTTLLCGDRVVMFDQALSRYAVLSAISCCVYTDQTLKLRQPYLIQETKIIPY